MTEQRIMVDAIGKTYTRLDYNRAVRVLKLGKKQLQPDGENCSICGDNGHQAFECHLNPLVAMDLMDKFRCYHCGLWFSEEEAENHFKQSENSDDKT
ncbi:MAG: hypothetical protein V3U75_04155 [Methylococcaceae bacterium]